VEPNPGLGKAIQYLLRHWKALTQFLGTTGAPLDNNVCERSLKKAILNRKKSLFYRISARSAGGRLIHEPAPHLRVERRKCLRLSHRLATQYRATSAQPRGLDALELSGEATE